MNGERNLIEGVDDDTNDDPCLSFVSNIVTRTMKMKHEKWIKLMAIDEYKVSHLNINRLNNNFNQWHTTISTIVFPFFFSILSFCFICI